MRHLLSLWLPLPSLHLLSLTLLASSLLTLTGASWHSVRIPMKSLMARNQVWLVPNNEWKIETLSPTFHKELNLANDTWSEAGSRSFPTKCSDDCRIGRRLMTPWEGPGARRLCYACLNSWPTVTLKKINGVILSHCVLGIICYTAIDNKYTLLSCTKTYFNFWNSSTRLDFCPGDILAKIVPFTRI